MTLKSFSKNCNTYCLSSQFIWMQILVINNHTFSSFFLSFSFCRALNLCRIFTEMGESYLPVIVEAPGRVSMHFIKYIIFDIPHRVLKWMIKIQDSICSLECNKNRFLGQVGTFHTAILIAFTSSQSKWSKKGTCQSGKWLIKSPNPTGLKISPSPF